MIQAAFDVDRVLLLATVPLEEALAVCGGVTEATYGYVLFDLDASGFSDATPPEALVGLMTANALQYQDEVFLGLRFSTRCNSVLLSLFEAFAKQLTPAERTDERRAGMAQARGGMVQVYKGAIISTVDGTRSANRDLLLDEAVLQADTMAASMAQADRSMVIGTIDQVLPYVAEASIRDRLQKIRTSMSRTDCGVLCSF